MNTGLAALVVLTTVLVWAKDFNKLEKQVADQVVTDLQKAGKTMASDGKIKEFVKPYKEKVRDAVVADFNHRIRAFAGKLVDMIREKRLRGVFSLDFECDNGIDDYYCDQARLSLKAMAAIRKLKLALTEAEKERIGKEVQKIMGNKGAYSNAGVLIPEFRAAGRKVKARLKWAERGSTVWLWVEILSMSRGVQGAPLKSLPITYPRRAMDEILARVVLDVKAGLARNRQEAATKQRAAKSARINEELKAVRALIGKERYEEALKELGNLAKMARDSKHPVVMGMRITKLRIEAENRLAGRRNHRLGYGLATVVLLLGGWLGVRVGRRRMLRARLDRDAAEIMGWLEQGHYVAAEKKVHKLLAVDPENERLLELQMKIELLTEGGTKAAERRLMLRKMAADTGIRIQKMLQSGDYEAVLGLAQKQPEVFQAAPELDTMVQQARTRIDARQTMLQLQSGLGRLRAMVRQDPGAAVRELEALAVKAPDMVEVQDLLAEARQAEAAIKQAGDRLRELLEQGRLGEFMQQARQAGNGVDKGLVRVAQAMERAVKGDRFVLRIQGVEQELRVFLNGEVVIGKLDTNDCVITRAVASRVHARVRLGAAGVFVKDLGSKNGTYVNDRRLEPEKETGLMPGDRLSVAKEVDLGLKVGVYGNRTAYAFLRGDLGGCLLLNGAFPLKGLGLDTGVVLAGGSGMLVFVSGRDVIPVEGTGQYTVDGLSITVEA